MSDTIICRTGFCQQCYDEGRPHSQDMFLAFGAYHDDFAIRYAQGNGQRGFVPMLYNNVKVIGGNVVIQKSCSFCGVDLWKDFGDWKYKVHWTRSMLTLADWNALVMYKHDPDYEI